MEVDTPPQQQQQPEQLDAEMADAAGVASTGAFAARTPVAALATAAPAPGAPTREEAAASAFLPPQQPPAIITAVAPPPAAAVAVAAAGAGPCVECVAAQGSAVEVRIVLDGCVFVGQLKEVSRLEMARSRVGAAVDPIKQVGNCGWLLPVGDASAFRFDLLPGMAADFHVSAATPM
jgi:hypothetical protein